MQNLAPTECFPPAEVNNRKQSGENIQIIDVRSPEEFAEKHIPGAVNLPLDGLGQAADKLDKNALFVTACGKGGGRSAAGAETLRQLGFQSVWLCGGTLGWVEEN
jgi:rhodanese-related sulfurtransferase